MASLVEGPNASVALSDHFPDSVHVRHIGLAEAQDREIWVHARESGFAIVWKDNDFQQMSFVFGAPPKVIWVHRGNCSVSEIEEILRANASRILAFNEDAGELVLGFVDVGVATPDNNKVAGSVRSRSLR